MYIKNTENNLEPVLGVKPVSEIKKMHWPSISLVFPKTLTSLNINHPIGIHVTNTRFPLHVRTLSWQRLVAGKEEVVCHNCILYQTSIVL